MVFGYAFTKYHLILSLRVQHFETYKSYKYLKFAFENVSRTTPRVIFRSSANRKSGENMRHFWWLSSIVAGTDAEILGMSENGVYPQWNSHLVGIMISKTIGCRGTLFSDKPILLQTWVSPRDPPIARSTPWGGDPLRPTLHFCLMQGCGNPLAFNWWLAPESPPNIGCLKKQHGKHLVVRGLICMATHLVGGLLRQFPQKLFQSMVFVRLWVRLG